MNKRFYSNGKLLLTGEYLVLDGAKSLALPTIYGQDLRISASSIPGLEWRSFDSKNNCWFETHLSYNEIIEGPLTDNREIRNMLLKILNGAYRQNPKFILENQSLSLETHLTFDRSWGLGTSSTLINNIADWTKTDAFKLLKTTFGGSGYDIAAAKASSAIIYQLFKGESHYTPINFKPSFRDNLYFIYLNRKQDSNETIKTYKKKKRVSLEIIVEINAITDRISTAVTLNDFCNDLQRHENILSEILEVATIKEQLFSDFQGTIKSLGGWGGDFILAAAHEDPSDYFKAKGYQIIIPYSKIILE